MQLQQVASGLQESLSGVAGDVRQSAETLERSSGEVRESAQALKAYHQDLRNAYTEMRTIFNESQAALSELSRQQLSRIAQMQEEFAASSDRIIVQLQQNAGDLAGTTGAFTQAGERFIGSELETQSHLQRGFAQLAENLGGALEKHRLEMGHVEDGVRLIAERLAGLAERLDPRMLPAGEWQALTDTLARCVEELNRVGERALPATPALSQSLPELPHEAAPPDGRDISRHLDKIHAVLQQGDVHADCGRSNRRCWPSNR